MFQSQKTMQILKESPCRFLVANMPVYSLDHGHVEWAEHDILFESDILGWIWFFLLDPSSHLVFHYMIHLEGGVPVPWKMYRFVSGTAHGMVVRVFKLNESPLQRKDKVTTGYRIAVGASHNNSERKTKIVVNTLVPIPHCSFSWRNKRQITSPHLLHLHVVFFLRFPHLHVPSQQTIKVGIAVDLRQYREGVEARKSAYYFILTIAYALFKESTLGIFWNPWRTSKTQNAARKKIIRIDRKNIMFTFVLTNRLAKKQFESLRFIRRWGRYQSRHIWSPSPPQLEPSRRRMICAPFTHNCFLLRLNSWLQ